MAEYTKKQVAEAFGCNKQTVANAIRELGLESHVVRRGNTDYIDEHAQSAIAAKLAERFPLDQPEPEKDPYRLLYEQERRDRLADAERCQRQLDQQQELIGAMQAQLSVERARAERLAAERDGAASDLAAAREALAKISAAGFFTNKRAIAAQYLALPAPRGQGLNPPNLVV